jgi:hypothetical protein
MDINPAVITTPTAKFQLNILNIDQGKTHTTVPDQTQYPFLHDP